MLGSIGWSTLESILLLPSSKIIYHTQIVWFIITHSIESSTSPHKFRNLFDPRIATYLCDSTLTEQDLELSSICGRFHHHYQYPNYHQYQLLLY